MVDRVPQPDSEWLIVIGEATGQTLRDAGIERATTLIAASTPMPTMYVTLSARALSPALHIVARTDHQHNEAKFFQAGAVGWSIPTRSAAAWVPSLCTRRWPSSSTRCCTTTATA